MKNKLIEILKTICPNVYLQGTLNDKEPYPESFITFWTNYTEYNAFYNDEAKADVWNFSVIYYSSNPTLVETEPKKIITALKNAGFLPQGKGNDIPSDEPTHTGWALEFIIKEF